MSIIQPMRTFLTHHATSGRPGFTLLQQYNAAMCASAAGATSTSLHVRQMMQAIHQPYVAALALPAGHRLRAPALAIGVALQSMADFSLFAVAVGLVAYVAARHGMGRGVEEAKAYVPMVFASNAIMMLPPATALYLLFGLHPANVYAAFA